jgi:hypothetical protein
VILFPIAFVWLAFVVIWALRQTLEPADGPWRPWRQRNRDPRGGPHGHRDGRQAVRTGRAASRRLGAGRRD